MNVPTDQIVGLIFQSIDELNELRPAESQLTKTLDSPIAGAAGGLDSLGFVNFVATLEEKIEATLGVSLALADSAQPTEKGDPYETVRTLAAHLHTLLAARAQ